MQNQFVLLAFQAGLQPDSPDDEVIGTQTGKNVPPSMTFQDHSPRKEEGVSCFQQMLAKDIVHIPDEESYQEQGDACEIPSISMSTVRDGFGAIPVSAIFHICCMMASASAGFLWRRAGRRCRSITYIPLKTTAQVKKA